ncbi:hypothetical protein [uncultured Spirosoma sp.]|uniref:hypothetical protein n=1 Tax=uncultured Spirosoma sp. TaxID=278208 RepID=UPI00258FEC97|nr:hypothetical protein [uncultured Spirosoma sp.]
MQIELFTSTPAPPEKPARKKRRSAGRKRREIVEPPGGPAVSLGLFSFETWVSYPARAVNAEDGLRIEFSVPVHSDLLAAVGEEKKEITCKYRVRKGFLWGGMGRRADIRIEAHLTAGPRGGLYLHCKQVDILKPVPIRGEALPKFLKNLNKQIRNADA